MIPITEFLTARYDEDEERATVYRDIMARLTIVFGPHDPDADGLHVGVAAHLALARTADRIDADIAAKRAIVALHAEVVAYVHRAPDGPDAADHARVSADTLVQVLIMLARPYAEHPDFDPAWKV